MKRNRVSWIRRFPSGAVAPTTRRLFARRKHCSIAGIHVLLWLWYGFFAAPALAATEEVQGLRPPRAELQPSFWEQHGWQIALAAVVFFTLVGLGVLWLRRPKQEIITPPAVLARSALEALRGRADEAEVVAQASRILRHYVVAVFALSSEELTTPQLRKALHSHPQASPELTAAIADFLSRCDEFKFAPALPRAPFMALDGALALIEKVESARKPAAQPSPLPS